MQRTGYAMEVKQMSPKDDQTPQSNKIFDVMRPGKAPASPTSRPVVGSGANVKDFDFADKPANSISKFGNDDFDFEMPKGDSGQKPGAPEMDFPGTSDQPAKKMIDLDQDAPDDDLSKIQSELGKTTESNEPKHSTDFKPDEFETSNTELDDEEMLKSEDETSDQDLEPSDDFFNEQPPEESSTDNNGNRQNEKPSQQTNDRRKAKTETNKQPDNSKPNKDSRPQNTSPKFEDDSVQSQPVANAATGQMIVSQHSRHPHLWAELFAILAIIVLLAGILNLLLDAGLVTLDGIPHTDFFSED